MGSGSANEEKNEAEEGSEAVAEDRAGKDESEEAATASSRVLPGTDRSA